MPLVAHNALPAFDSLRREDIDVVEVPNQDLPTLRIGLLNLVPDAVLQATERQFMRLVAGYGEANVSVLPIGVATDHRGGEARQHVQSHYETLESIRESGVDALIVTGANPLTDRLEDEVFWLPMLEVIDWGREQGCSILCSCLAVHAVMQAYFDTPRSRLPQKCWGIYPHAITDPSHRLVQRIQEPWHAPHSHWYSITAEQVEANGGRVLVDSDEAGFLLAVSDPNEQFLLFQAHPEYDSNSLLKEYKRDISQWFANLQEDYPPFPKNYLPAAAQRRLAEYREQIESSRQQGAAQPEFPESELLPHLENRWMLSGVTVFHNWLCGMLSDAGRVTHAESTAAT